MDTLRIAYLRARANDCDIRVALLFALNRSTHALLASFTRR